MKKVSHNYLFCASNIGDPSTPAPRSPTHCHSERLPTEALCVGGKHRAFAVRSLP